MKKTVIIFTDLDGTLLDHHTYSTDKVRNALDYIRKNDVPLVIVTSKTHKEVEKLTKTLEIHYPFIVENGSAIVFPTDWNYGESERIVLGKPVRELFPVYQQLKKEFPIRGFPDMSVDEIMQYTQLHSEDALAAKKREYSIPIILEAFDKETVIKQIKDVCRDHGCNLLEGGRFFHLLGNTSKGKAIHFLKNRFVEKGILAKEFVSFGLGDAPNDTDIFTEVDVPILVEKAGGGYREPERIISRLNYARGEGPSGWQWAFDQIIKPRIAQKEA
jgi:mannosyl-3-phosphoglycerate phosphatase